MEDVNPWQEYVIRALIFAESSVFRYNASDMDLPQMLSTERQETLGI